MITFEVSRGRQLGVQSGHQVAGVGGNLDHFGFDKFPKIVNRSRFAWFIVASCSLSRVIFPSRLTMASNTSVSVWEEFVTNYTNPRDMTAFYFTLVASVAITLFLLAFFESTNMKIL